MWSDGPSDGQVVGRVVWWKYFAASHGKGVNDGVGGALKAREAQYSKGKYRDSVSVRSYMNFYNLAKEDCPKVTLFHLRKENVETNTEEDKPWDNVKPISGISSGHVAKCGLDGTIQMWKLPGSEDPLKPIKYQISTQPSTSHNSSSHASCSTYTIIPTPTCESR